MVASVVQGSPAVFRICIFEEIRVSEDYARDYRKVIVDNCPAKANCWVNHCDRKREREKERGRRDGVERSLNWQEMNMKGEII